MGRDGTSTKWTHGAKGIYLGSRRDIERRRFLSETNSMQMDICKNCNSHGMRRISKDTMMLERRCCLCGWRELVTNEMKRESKEKVRP